jgi:DNA-binding winged helix-turn-helix (wHTH) protein
MTSQTPPTTDFRLGDWLVQPTLNTLTRGAEVVHVRPRLMDLLGFLVANAGKVVAKETILHEVWGREFLAESVLTRTIAELRKVLGDSASRPRFIENVPKRGYRVIAPVERCNHQPFPDDDGIACFILYGEQQIPLPPGEHLIGRASDVAVVLNLPEVSRHHARLLVKEGHTVLEDLGSKNGTRVGRERVVGSRLLRSGDEIRIGPALLRFCLPPRLQSTETSPAG